MNSGQRKPAGAMLDGSTEPPGEAAVGGSENDPSIRMTINPLPAGSASDVDDPAPGTHLGRYRVVSKLGCGNMGCVYKAVDDAAGGQLVAIKLLKRATLGEETVQDYRRELLMIAQLGQIPGVVRVTNSDFDRPTPYIVTEYIDGWNLDRFVVEQCPSRAERVAILADLCDTLEVMHAAGVIHRDLKPANIRIRRQQVAGRWIPVVIDFGIAVNRSADGSADGGLSCTPQYASPEHGIASSLGPRSDVYSLGVTAYWLLTEAFPYKVDAEDIKAIRQATWRPFVLPMPQPQDVRAGVPEKLESIVRHALELKPVDRFQTAAEFGGALRGWLSEPAPKPDPRWPRRVFLALSAVIVIVFLGLVAKRWAFTAQVSSHPLPVTRSASQPTAPARVRVSVLRQGWVDLAHAGPLANGDRVRIDCDIPHRVYASLFLLDPAGSLKELAHLDASAPDRALSYPEPGEAVPLTEPSGTELLVLVERKDRPTDIASLSSGWPWKGGCPLLDPGELALLQNNTVEFEPVSRGLGRPERVDDPRSVTGERLKQLQKWLGGQDVDVQAVAFSHKPGAS